MKCTISSMCRLLLSAAVLACSLPTSAAQVDSNYDIIVLSNRADLISGGDALVEVIVPHGIIQAIRNGNEKVQAFIDGAPVPDGTLALRPDGRIYGLVDGFKVGTNTLTVIAPGKQTHIVITNHPIGGPVFAGAQLQPWVCATAVAIPNPPGVDIEGNAGQVTKVRTGANGLDSDATPPVNFPSGTSKCDAPPAYRYYYQPKAKEGTACTFTITGGDPCFLPYPVLSDPSTRPANAAIADFTNDRGATVKSLIRVERGSINRGIYSLVTFYDPLDPNVAWAPPRGWNQKLHWKFGAASSVSRFQTDPGVGAIFDQNALRRGFMVGASSLTNNGTNANNTLAAETMMMIKERIVENYGEIRYTMSDGGSGGSIMQHAIASAYPGLTNGVQTTISYPDHISIWMEVQDCGLLQATAAQSTAGTPVAGYYNRPGSPGLLLTQPQRVAINGHAASTGASQTGFCNAWTGSFLGAANPQSAGNCGAGFPASLVYNTATNPMGIRCDTYNHDVGMVGTFVDTDGNTKANLPRDNVGLQYGLKALLLPAGDPGKISPEEFVLLNEGIGGYNADRVWGASRMSADPAALHTYYSGGLVSDGRQLAKIPMIDMRTQNGLGGDIHMNWRSKSLRDRLDRDYGSHDTHVIWSGSQTGLGAESFATMDAWLANIESDLSANPVEVKVVNNKPVGVVDFCRLADGTRIGLDDPACPVKYFGSPRIAAGGTLAENIFKCQLKPLNFSDPDYTGVTFDAGQQARLQAVFPNGVCDWSKPGVAQVPVNPWTTFKAGPGGVPLGPEPEAFH